MQAVRRVSRSTIWGRSDPIGLGGSGLGRRIVSRLASADGAAQATAAEQTAAGVAANAVRAHAVMMATCLRHVFAPVALGACVAGTTTFGAVMVALVKAIDDFAWMVQLGAGAVVWVVTVTLVQSAMAYMYRVAQAAPALPPGEQTWFDRLKDACRRRLLGLPRARLAEPGVEGGGQPSPPD